MFALPSGFELTLLMCWLLVLHLAKRLIDTFYAVPYLALGAEISSDHEERTRIATMRSVFFSIGRAAAGLVLLLVFLRPTVEYPNGQLNPDAYPRFAALMTLVIAAALLASAWRTRIWIPRLSTAKSVGGHGLRAIYRELRQALAYRSFRAVLLGSVSRHMAWGMSDALGIFMATYFWQVSTDILVVWGVGMITGIFTGLPFWRRLAARIDKKPVAILGDVTYLVFFCTPYLLKIAGFWPEHESPLYISLYVFTTGFLAHFGIAASGPLMGSMLGDVTDLGRARARAQTRGCDLRRRVVHLEGAHRTRSPRSRPGHRRGGAQRPGRAGGCGGLGGGRPRSGAGRADGGLLHPGNLLHQPIRPESPSTQEDRGGARSAQIWRLRPPGSQAGSIESSYLALGGRANHESSRIPRTQRYPLRRGRKADA